MSHTHGWVMSYVPCVMAQLCCTVRVAACCNNIHSLQYDSYDMTHVICVQHMSHVICAMTHVICAMSHVICAMSHVICAMSHVIYIRISHIYTNKCHVCHESCHMCQQSVRERSVTKIYEWVRSHTYKWVTWMSQVTYIRISHVNESGHIYTNKSHEWVRSHIFWYSHISFEWICERHSHIDLIFTHWYSHIHTYLLNEFVTEIYITHRCEWVCDSYISQSQIHSL